jgi:hypothetical protein
MDAETGIDQQSHATDQTEDQAGDHGNEQAEDRAGGQAGGQAADPAEDRDNEQADDRDREVDLSEIRKDDGQEYLDRDKLDFDPDDGLYSGTAVDGTSEIPGPHDEEGDEESIIAQAKEMAPDDASGEAGSSQSGPGQTDDSKPEDSKPEADEQEQ